MTITDSIILAAARLRTFTVEDLTVAAWNLNRDVSFDRAKQYPCSNKVRAALSGSLFPRGLIERRGDKLALTATGKRAATAMRGV